MDEKQPHKTLLAEREIIAYFYKVVSRLNPTRMQVQTRFRYIRIGIMNSASYLGSPGCGLNAAMIG